MKKESMGRIEAIFFIHYQDIEKKIFVKLVMNNIGKCPLISVPVGEINNRLDMLLIHPLMMQISSLSPVSEKVAAHFMNGVTHRFSIVSHIVSRIVSVLNSGDCRYYHCLNYVCDSR